MVMRVIGVVGTSREERSRGKLRDSNRKNLESAIGQMDILPLPI